MNILSFQTALEDLPVMTVQDMLLHFPEFDRNNLVRWQDKGYIQKLRNGYYRFQKQPLDQARLFLIAGKLYAPSYISLESALAYHGLIPEGVFAITSVTTLKTQRFATAIGHFDYRSIKHSRFFGAQLVDSGSYAFKMANPVKALLDFLYFRTDIREVGHLEELRLNIPALQAAFLDYPLEEYLSAMDSIPLEKKIQNLYKLM